MSSVFHAFKKYHIEGDNEDDYKIVYEDDKNMDIAAGNWTYIYTVLDYGSSLIGTRIDLPVYDYLDDALKVKNNGINDLVDPSIVISALEAAISKIVVIKNGEKPNVSKYSDVFREELRLTHNEQRDNLLFYANMLLTWAKDGLYFVVERE